MQIAIILFFASLVGIAFMIGRKILTLRKTSAGTIKMENAEEFLFEIPNLEDVRYAIAKNIRRYGFVALVITIRLYILSWDFLKNKYTETTEKAKDKIKKYIPHKEKVIKEKEISGFLKTISDYKQKIKRIKHRIKQEEGIK